MNAGLHAAFGYDIGNLELDIELHAPPGELVVVVGPNGAGKTTLLRCLAGLLAIDRGRIQLDGVVLDEPAAGVFAPAVERRIGVVFQDGLLFQQLNALENVAFGPRARGVARGVARRRAHEWLDRMGLGAFADRRPAELSGGQAQRVALARALATEPRMLLLDEPLAALDAATRIDVRRALRDHLSSFEGPRLMVTHDPIEALTMADRIVVVEAGRVVQQGTSDEIRQAPRSDYVARLVGVNLLDGTVARGEFTGTSGLKLSVAVAPDNSRDGPCIALVPPSAVTISMQPPASSARNMWPTAILDLDREPDRVRLRLQVPDGFVADVTHGAVQELGLAPGRTVWCTVKATAIELLAR